MKVYSVCYSTGNGHSKTTVRARTFIKKDLAVGYMNYLKEFAIKKKLMRDDDNEDIIYKNEYKNLFPYIDALWGIKDFTIEEIKVEYE